MASTRVEETLRYEEHSAEFWSTHLGRYGGDMYERASRFALLSAAVSALTGAAVWTTLSDSTNVWAQVVVTAMAVAAAVLASWPAQAGYTTCATQSAKLSDDYASALVQLRRAHDHLDAHQRGAAKEVEQAEQTFDRARAGKEALRPYPKELQEEVEGLRVQLEIQAPATMAPHRF